MNHVYKRLTTFDFREEVFHPSKLPQFEIKLLFFFKSQNKHFILHQNQPQYLLQTLPSSDGMTSAAVAAPPLDQKHVAEAVTKAVGSRLLARELGPLIELAHEHVRRSFLTAETPARRGVLNLCFQVRIEHRHVYNFVGGGPRMVPAADHAFALLEECGRADVAEEERCCCICLEELGGGGGGGGAVRMPCKHVFHGGCIKKWLTKSHYCPLCRYEMQTE